MRKILLLLILSIIVTSGVSVCFAQEEEPAPPQQFSHLLFRDHFSVNDGQENYYRFPTLRTLYDPLDLSYFPHDILWEYDWSLLRRKSDNGLYEQLLMLDKPASQLVIQGTAIGKEYGFLDNFYLYATLFTADTYPADSGSCYVYFSDSLLRGYQTAHGILIDPASGIYRAENTYTFYYEPSRSAYDLRLLREISAEDYPLPDDISSTTVWASEFDPNVDEQFLSDWNTLKSSYRMKGSPEVKAYRIEALRKGFYTDVFINGKRAVRMLDFITTTDEDENEIPNKVSWSYGPILYPGGITSSCAIGDLYIYGKAAE